MSSESRPIEDLPPLIIGGAVLNDIYSDDPTKVPVLEILLTAFSKGYNALDTSPYYGRSEELIGKSLKQIAKDWPRESYYICTKAGRLTLEEFDYSRDWVRKSVQRSLKRLHTSYLDLVYMHDIEFVEETDVFEALKELVALKKEGVVRYIGVTGYPVEFLLKVAQECNSTYKQEIGPLDAILSYSHGCLQNIKLFDLYDKFFETGIKKLMNGSILSMSLLRSGSTHSFHPASKELRESSSDAAKVLLDEDNVELADLSTRFALKRTLFQTGKEGEISTSYPLKWNKKLSVVLGVSSLEELDLAIQGFKSVQTSENKKDEELFEKFQRELGAEHINETWSSGRF